MRSQMRPTQEFVRLKPPYILPGSRKIATRLPDFWVGITAKALGREGLGKQNDKQ